jgi:hypothetical protein
VFRFRLSIARHRMSRRHRRDFPFAQYPEGPRLGEAKRRADWTWNAPTVVKLPAVPVVLPEVAPVRTDLIPNGTDVNPLRHPLLTPDAKARSTWPTNRVDARRRGEGR